MSGKSRKSIAKKWTLIVLIIFVLVAIIGSTYSRYTSTGQTSATVPIAKWAIAINDTDITPAGNTQFTIEFNELDDNDYVVDGKIAPGTSVYADFVIDPTGSEVAIDYTFTLGSITPAVTDLAIASVSASTGTTYDSANAETLTGNNGTYTGSIELVDQDTALTANEAITVRVVLTWTDTRANDAVHTATGASASPVTMTVTGTATQKVS